MIVLWNSTKNVCVSGKAAAETKGEANVFSVGVAKLNACEMECAIEVGKRLSERFCQRMKVVVKVE